MLRWTDPTRVAFFYCLLAVALTMGTTDSRSEDSLTLDGRLTHSWQQTISPLLEKHCGECHLHSANEGGANFDDYQSLEKIRSHASTWEQIRGLIRADAMPPPNEATISIDERKTICDWIESALHDVDCGCNASTPEVTVRRLNQIEYDNTIRDLLGLDVHPSKDFGFVSDDVGNGFDNQGEVLTLPPISLEKYLQAAIWISEHTIATDREKFRRQHFEGEAVEFGRSMKTPLHLAKGKYQVQVRARFGDDQKDGCRARLRLGEVVIAEWDVGPKDETYKYDMEAAQVDSDLVLEYFDDSDVEKRYAANRRLMVESIRVIGPEGGKPAFPMVHERLVIATPDQQDAPELQPIGFSEASRRVFQKLLPRAYRRQVSGDEVQSVVIVTERAHDAGFSFEESLRYGLQAVLVAPQFLFRSEKEVEVGPAVQVDDFGLASRLSYFLWSSMPDDRLLELAAEGRLRDDSILLAELQRMIDDPKSDALLSGYFGQWLGLRNLNKIEIDKDKYPVWSERLRASIIRETELFCRSLLKEGRIEDFLLADFTFVNPRLAEYYGVQFEGRDPSEMYRRKAKGRGNEQRRLGLYDDEDKWVRVTLPNNRKGILTQAAVLALTSNPTRTSPVKRGKWILENMLGDPPPSAPPNVPTLEKAIAPANATLRERLEIHRSNPSCAGCHKLMDPIGLGLENFDTIGRWREKDGETLIGAQGELADGRNFAGPSELVQLLASREDAIARNFATRLLTYALGRGLQRVDKCDVDQILDRSKPTRYALRSIVEGIVLSNAFKQRSQIQPTSASPSIDNHE